jgi:hypothetical protein
MRPKRGQFLRVFRTDDSSRQSARSNGVSEVRGSGVAPRKVIELGQVFLQHGLRYFRPGRG